MHYKLNPPPTWWGIIFASRLHIYMQYNWIDMKNTSASYQYETNLRKKGSILVAGIDEVGRGCLAGPLVAAAVVLPSDQSFALFDSKSISRTKRESIAKQVKEISLSYGLGWVTNSEIDDFGLAWALQEAYIRALVDLKLEVSRIILDGNVNYLQEFDICETCIQGDQKVACVAAASIFAKVARDDYMIGLSGKYTKYGYETNVGYGTVSHREAIKKHGISDLHRKSFCTNFVK